MLRHPLLLAAALFLTLSSVGPGHRAARAADAAVPESDSRRIAYQLAAGLGVSLVGYLGSGLLLLDADDRELEAKHFALIGAFAVTTALTGWVTCLVGRGSPRYTGHCSGAMAGAFVGLLPLAVGAGACLAAEAGETCYTVAIATLAVAPAVGATIGWNATKRPRPSETDFMSRRILDPASERRLATAPGGRWTIPLLALRF